MSLADESVVLRSRTFILRPIAPHDAPGWVRFLAGLSWATRYKRAARKVEDLTPEAIAEATAPDPASEVAIVATTEDGDDEHEIAGVGRLKMRRAEPTGEFMLVVGDRWQRHGLGARLLDRLVREARARSLRQVEGFVLATNKGMLDFCAREGFRIEPCPSQRFLRRAILDLA